MSRHLKTRVINGLKSSIATFVDLPAGTRHTRGVRYFRACTGIDMLWGAMDAEKLGRKYKKRIVVRPSRFRDGLFELYTYHFPTQWSAACVANRELIKEAQRQAHALEHASTPEALEWKLRFFHHYFNVVKGHATPEPGLKPYTRFYPYAYVSIYRQLQSASTTKANANADFTNANADFTNTNADFTFEPIYPKINRRRLSLVPPANPRPSFAPYYVNGLRLPLSASSSASLPLSASAIPSPRLPLSAIPSPLPPPR